MFYIVMEEENDGYKGEIEEVEGDEVDLPVDSEVSLHALHGTRTSNSMKINGMVNKRKITILMDSGSTHSYLDENTARELRIDAEPTSPWVITVVNRERIISRGKCRKFSWVTQGHKFKADLKIIPIGGCDVILGHDWMWDHDPVTLHLKKNCVDIYQDGRNIKLSGEGEQATIRYMSGKGLKKMV